MSSSFFAYLFAGKILIFFGMKFAQDNGITKGFIGRLLSCDLCWGFWVYSLLSLLLGETLFDEFFYFKFISEFITGGLVSLFIHLVTLGWKSKFEVIEIP